MKLGMIIMPLETIPTLYKAFDRIAPEESVAVAHSTRSLVGPAGLNFGNEKSLSFRESKPRHAGGSTY
jgi:hypothetical protein